MNPDTRSDRGFDVLINFRGPDSRDTVTDVLYDKLTRAGFCVFLDDEEIRKGEVIEGELLRAITNSKIYIAIFSKDYASSKWCLRELTKMIECWETSSGSTKKVMLPIFFGVDVSKDVKLRSNVYTTALQQHEKELGKAVVKPWRDALQKVAQIKGWDMKNYRLSKLAGLIEKEVFSKLTASRAVPIVPNRLVGIDKLVEDIMKLLALGSSGFRFIVIHGMGGVGKTTLAKAVFKKISSRFQGRCFLKDVRQSLSDHDIVKLQEKLLLDTLNLKFIKVVDIDDGKDLISTRLRDQDILIVLDDVDERDHLLNLTAESFWFKAQSRIIITTRNTGFLPTKDDRYHFYEMEEMDHGLALQLFSQHAFGKYRPEPEFYDISNEIVATTGRLPLSLQVIGSSLYSQDEEIWKFRLEKLKEAPHKDVQKTLMISYEALEYEQQQIFLDIACLFNNEKLMDPIYFWKACKLHPECSIKILMQRSLIKVYNDDTLWMHDQLRDLGRTIAQSKMPGLQSQFPTEPSRLWSPEYALDALHKREVNKSITAVKLGKLDVHCHFASAEFARAENLLFLECKEAKQLKVMHLEDYKHPKKALDFSAFLELERLIIRDCKELEEIDRCINKLEHLSYLEISNHYGIYQQYVSTMPTLPRLLPDSIGGLKALIELKIKNVGLSKLHPSIGQLVNLKLLWLRCPQLEILPCSIGELTSLVELDLSESGVRELPNSFGDLKQLIILRMKHIAVKDLPDTIGSLESLEELDLYNSKITQLPETIGKLKRLKVINVSFSNITVLPKALVEVENLQVLNAYRCRRMEGELPKEIGKLSCLSILNLKGTNVGRVPTTINQLSHLYELTLQEIYQPEQLSKLPTSLRRLTVSIMIHRIVPDLSNMTNLVSLRLYGAKSTDMNPYLSSPFTPTPYMKWLARLTKLEDLILELPHLKSLPSELNSLSRLHSLAVTCSDPQSLTHVPSSLQSLRLIGVKSPIDWHLLSSLKNLSNFMLDRCCLTEIKIDGLEQLHVLQLFDCDFLERLSNLSTLKELRQLDLKYCRKLVDMEGLGELKSLRSLRVLGCHSIQRLHDISRLKKLEYLDIHNYDYLESVLDLDEEAPCCLELSGCRHIPNYKGCLLGEPCCLEVLRCRHIPDYKRWNDLELNLDYL